MHSNLIDAILAVIDNGLLEAAPAYRPDCEQFCTIGRDFNEGRSDGFADPAVLDDFTPRPASAAPVERLSAIPAWREVA
jgi:hypothetical protein